MFTLLQALQFKSKFCKEFCKKNHKKGVEKMENNEGTRKGIFLPLLTILFIALKLTGYIDWSWWWILSPLWIPYGLATIIILFVMFIRFIKNIFNKLDI